MQAATVKRAGLIATLLWAATASPAAASSDDRSLSVALRYATFTVDENNGDGEDTLSPDGAAIGIDYEHGVSDAVSLRASAQSGLYFSDPLSFSGQATVGLVYALDVIKYVPHAGLAAGAAMIAGGDQGTSFHPLLELSLGFDILQSRTLSYGVGIRFAAFATEAQLFSAGARVTWRWGFF